MPPKTSSVSRYIVISMVRVHLQRERKFFISAFPCFELRTHDCFLLLHHSGASINKRQTVREGVVKLMAKDEAREKCPYYHQVRLVAFHHIQAKGPILARSMARKVLGNEEFCMQIDAHTDFVKDWDKLVIEEWEKTENEFGIISTVPADKASKSMYTESGSQVTEVPRQCMVRFLDNGFPVSRLGVHMVLP